jgi:rhodanese-related sulfurtransferase
MGAAEYFASNGFTLVYSLDGGYAEYSKHNSR